MSTKTEASSLLQIVQLKDIRWDGLIHTEFPQTIYVVCFSFPKSLFTITIPIKFIHIFCFH